MVAFNIKKQMFIRGEERPGFGQVDEKQGRDILINLEDFASKWIKQTLKGEWNATAIWTRQLHDVPCSLSFIGKHNLIYTIDFLTKISDNFKSSGLFYYYLKRSFPIILFIYSSLDLVIKDFNFMIWFRHDV